MEAGRIAVLQPLKSTRAGRIASGVAASFRRKGVEATVFDRSEDISEFRPDFVLVLHHQEPKLTAFPTYGVISDAPGRLQTPRYLRNILGYDAYFTLAEPVRQWLEDITFGARKLGAPIGFFGTTAPATAFSPPSGDAPPLTLSGPQPEEDAVALVQLLLKRPYLKLSESPPPPSPDGAAIESPFPARAGLCLDPLHDDQGLPPDTLWEIVAAGAIAICPRSAFVERWFGQTVLYIEPDAPPEVQAWQIDRHIHWIEHRPDDAVALARQAHAVFAERLSIDALSQGVFDLHRQVCEEKSRMFWHARPDQAVPSVTYILRTEGSPRHALASLRAQAHPDLRVVIVPLRDCAALPSVAVEFEDLQPVVLPFDGEGRCSALWRGLRHVRESGTDLFGLVEDCDELFPNHVRTLVRTLDYLDRRTWHGHCALAYSGNVECAAGTFSSDRIVDDHSPAGGRKLRPGLFHFYHPGNLDKGAHHVHWASFLARTCLLDDELLVDPVLEEDEDSYLQLLLAEKTLFGFSSEVTSIVAGRNETDAAKAELPASASAQRILLRTMGRSFPAAAMYVHSVIFLTRFDNDIMAPVIRAEVGEKRRSVRLPGPQAFGTAGAEADGIWFSGGPGSGVLFPGLRLAPGVYQLSCYFAVEADLPADRSLFAVSVTTDPGGSDSIAVTEESRPISGAVLSNSEFCVAPPSGPRLLSIRLEGAKGGTFRFLGARLQRFPRVVRTSLLELPSGRPLWIYGAGEGGTIMKRKLDLLGMKVTGFVDRDKTGSHERIPIIGLDEARRVIDEGKTLLIASMFWQEIEASLERLGIVTNLFSAYPFAGDTVYALN